MAFSPTASPRASETITQFYQRPMNETRFSPFGRDVASSAESSPMTSPGSGRTTLHRRFTSETIRPTYTQVLPTTTTASNSSLTSGSEDERTRQLQDEQRNLAEQIQRLQIMSQQNELVLRGLHQGEQPAQKFQAARSFAEPTTPPEHDYIFGTSINSKLNDKSFKPIEMQGSTNYQLMTPPADEALQNTSSSRSNPSSRRESEDIRRGSHWSNTTKQRGALPFHDSSSSLSSTVDRNNYQSLGQHIQPNFPFEASPVLNKSLASVEALAVSPSDAKTFFQMNTATDDFPILRTIPGSYTITNGQSKTLKSTEENQGWPTFPRHRPGQQSLPANTLPFNPASSFASKFQMSSPETLSSYPQDDSSVYSKKGPSLEDEGFGIFTPLAGPGRHGSLTSPRNAPKLQPSLSASDIPTMRSISSGTIPSTNNQVLVDRHRRESATDFTSISNSSFGPPLYHTSMSQSPISPLGASPLPSPRFASYHTANIANSLYSGAPGEQYTPSTSVSANLINPKASNFLGSTSPTRGNSSRKAFDGEGNRFSNIDVESLGAEIYLLCKDQHGCRFLQRKLEEQAPKDVEIIFRETQVHVVELMTDPFGNYLCQKLLEHTNNEQRSQLVNNASPHLVEIALNQHGTRALQKMIEFLSTPDQIQTVIQALRSKVVELIQDLNGNHVIQKCLNRLKAEDAQFIFDAVGKNCVTVGTHRHGCCVLQRCIDHASKGQRAELITHITENAFALVRDPFGNYVVQYILDLGEPHLSEPMIHKFLGRISELSMQKFSSNVIEKCIRVSEAETRALMIKEIVSPGNLEKLIRDSYANYVIQTALDYAEADMRELLIDNLRPILPSIRMTPYGRRIQSKIQGLSGMSPDGLGAVFETTYRLGPIPPMQTQPRLAPSAYGHFATQVTRNHNIQNQNNFPIPYQNDMASNAFIL